MLVCVRTSQVSSLKLQKKSPSTHRRPNQAIPLLRFEDSTTAAIRLAELALDQRR